MYYDYIKDNNFTELKEAELMRDRLTLLQQVDPYTGTYFSMDWIRRHVLRLTDDEIAEIDKEIEEDKKDGDHIPTEVKNMVLQTSMTTQAQMEAQGQQPGAQNQSQGQSSNQDQTKGDLNLTGESTLLKKVRRVL
jgi:hypothetical protein